MTTPATHLPRTVSNDRSLLPYALGVVAVAVAIALALPLFTGSGGAPSTTSADATREWTRAETIEHLIRVNGLAVTGSAAGAPVATQEVTRDDVLDRLYRINGVTPVEPEVPAHAR